MTDNNSEIYPSLIDPDSNIPEEDIMGYGVPPKKNINKSSPVHHKQKVSSSSQPIGQIIGSTLHVGNRSHRNLKHWSGINR